MGRSIALYRIGVLLVSLGALLVWADRGLAGSDGVGPQAITLPSGPGSVSGLGGNFQTALNTGVGSFDIPMRIPPGANGLVPEVGLFYNSAAGNGVCGMGWSIRGAFVGRSQEKGVSTYSDADAWIFSSGEKLVRIRDDDRWPTRAFFLQEREGTFTRFEFKPKAAQDGMDYWESVGKDGTVTVYGYSPQARIADPERPEQILLWLIESVRDVFGNLMTYTWIKDGAQSYLHEIRYAYREPSATIYNSVHYAYDDRPDILTCFNAGFEVATRYRLASIEVRTNGQRITKYKLEYAPDTPLSLLRRVTQYSRLADDSEFLPPVEFTYTGLTSDSQIALMADSPPVDLVSGNVSLIDLNADALPDVLWTDSRSRHYYFLNKNGREWAWNDLSHQMAGDEDALALQLKVPQTHLADLNGDARVDLFWKSPGGIHNYDFPVYSLNAGSGLITPPSWEIKINCAEPLPSFQLNSADTRMIDLNADGRLDVMATLGRGYCQYWLNKGLDSNGDLSWTQGDGVLLREEALRPEDPTFAAGATLADMGGDGLLDVVMLNGGIVCWWPNRGWNPANASRGLFGPMRTMEPSLAIPKGLEKDLQWADLNGDGMADLLALDYGVLHYWINQGTTWTDADTSTIGKAEPVQLPIPGFDRHEQVRLADVNGNGSIDVVFFQPDRVRYVDLTGGVRPNLLKTITNGLGKRTMVEYRSSTDYYVDDLGTPRQWVMAVPFPVQVVSRIIVEDGVQHVHDPVTGKDNRLIIEHAYHDGYYDARKKQFRGFRTAEKREVGDATYPTTVQRFKYNVGDKNDALRGMVEAASVTNADGLVYDYRETTYMQRRLFQPSDSTVRVEPNCTIDLVLPDRTDTWIVEGAWKRRPDNSFETVAGAAEPVHTIVEMTYDDWGNMMASASYGQVDGNDYLVGNDEIYAYTEFANFTEPDHWRLGVVLRSYKREMPDGEYIDLRRCCYDGPDFEGLPFGQVGVGLLKKTEIWDGQQWIVTARYKYDPYGNVVAVKDTFGRLSEVDLDETFHSLPVRSRVYGNGQVFETSAQYDPVLWALTRSIDLNGYATGYEYDNWGRIKKIVAPGDTNDLPTTEYAYHLDNPVSWVEVHAREESGGRQTLDQRTYFSGLGRPIMTKSEREEGPEGAIRYQVEAIALYDCRGAAYRTFLPEFTSTWEYEPPESFTTEQHNHSDVTYDILGRRIRIEPFGADKTPTAILFRPSDIEVWDAEDNATEGVHYATPHIKRYDGLGRLIEMREMNQGQTYVSRFEYDKRGNLTRYVDAQGNKTRMTFDFLGRQVSLDDPDSGLSTFTYDDLGRLVTSTDAKGQTKTHFYDDLDRPIRIDYSTTPDNPADVTFHYDNPSPYMPEATNLKGQLSWRTDDTGGAFYSYDHRGRAHITGRDLFGTVYLSRTTYDDLNRTTTLTYPDQAVVEYHYDQAGRLKDVPGYLDRITYKADGQLETLTYHNGIQHDYTYDDRLRLKTVRATTQQGLGTRIQDLEFDFDLTNNIVAIQDHRFDSQLAQPANSHAQTFVYDDLYRLTHADGAYGQMDHTYDALGNILTRISSDAVVNIGAYAYGTRRNTGQAGPHAVTATDRWTFEYDQCGSMVRRRNRADQSTIAAYEYDLNGNLSRVVLADGTITENTYDAHGDRVRKRSVSPQGQVRETLYIGSGYEIEDGVASRYVFGLGRRIARIYGATAPDRGVLANLLRHRGVLGPRLPGEYRPLRPAEFRSQMVQCTAAMAGVCLCLAAGIFRAALRRTGSELAWVWRHVPASRIALTACTIIAMTAQPVAGGSVHSGPVAQTQPLESGTYYYHTDHLGSSLLITDARGEIVEETAYRPYGSVCYHTGPRAGRYSFTGQEFDDEAGLFHLGARFYDPILARFISADSLVPGTHDPQNFNRYAYVNNNPVRYSDPSGCGFFDGVLDVLRIAAPIVAAAVVFAVVVYFCPGNIVAAYTAAGFAAGFTSGLVNGQGLGTSLKMGAVGAAAGFVSGGIASAGTGFGYSMAGAAAGSFSGSMASSAIMGTDFSLDNALVQALLAGCTASLGYKLGKVGGSTSVGAGVGAFAGAFAGGILSGKSAAEALVIGVEVGVGTYAGTEAGRQTGESVDQILSAEKKTDLYKKEAVMKKLLDGMVAERKAGRARMDPYERYPVLGRYHCENDNLPPPYGGWHHWTGINPDQTYEQLAATVAHEATHAMQGCPHVVTYCDEQDAYFVGAKFQKALFPESRPFIPSSSEILESYSELRPTFAEWRICPISGPPWQYDLWRSGELSRH